MYLSLSLSLFLFLILILILSHTHAYIHTLSLSFSLSTSRSCFARVIRAQLEKYCLPLLEEKYMYTYALFLFRRVPSTCVTWLYLCRYILARRYICFSLCEYAWLTVPVCDRMTEREQPFVSNESARERINDREYVVEKEGEGRKKI